MRSLLRITVCLPALLLMGCQMDMFSGPAMCWDSFGCGSPPGGIGGPAAFIMGLPRAKLDTTAIATRGGARGLLHVGDTVTLYVVSATDFPNDTLRTVGWSADTSTARISVRSDGGLTLVATALGQVTVYTGDIGAVWSSCETVASVSTCTNMGEIDVIP